MEELWRSCGETLVIHGLLRCVCVCVCVPCTPATMPSDHDYGGQCLGVIVRTFSLYLVIARNVPSSSLQLLRLR